MASTLCPACSTRVEHPANFAVVVVQSETPDGLQTKLVANETIVVHASMTPREIDGNPEGT